MSIEWRGGVPVAQRITGITTTGREVRLERDQCSRVTTKWLRINNVGTEDLEVFWTKDDFTAGVEYTTIAAGEIFREPLEATTIWVRSAAVTTNIEILSFHRRG